MGTRLWLASLLLSMTTGSLTLAVTPAAGGGAGLGIAALVLTRSFNCGTVVPVEPLQ